MSWNSRTVGALIGAGIFAGAGFYISTRKAFSAQFVARPIVLCGPSGAGKSTLLKRIFAEYPDKFGFSVSHTTRKPRSGEVNGKDYHFVSKEEMERDIAAGLFIESAKFSGNYYGTSFAAIQAVLNENKSPILDIDMQGVQTLQKQLDSGEAKLTPKPLFVFLAPPSAAELENRLKSRGTESAESLAARLSAAKAELEWGLKGAQSGLDHVIVNDDVEIAYKKLKRILLVE